MLHNHGNNSSPGHISSVNEDIRYIKIVPFDCINVHITVLAASSVYMAC